MRGWRRVTPISCYAFHMIGNQIGVGTVCDGVSTTVEVLVGWSVAEGVSVGATALVAVVVGDGECAGGRVPVGCVVGDDVEVAIAVGVATTVSAIR